MFLLQLLYLFLQFNNFGVVRFLLCLCFLAVAFDLLINFIQLVLNLFLSRLVNFGLAIHLGVKLAYLTSELGFCLLVLLLHFFLEASKLGVEV